MGIFTTRDTRRSTGTTSHCVGLAIGLVLVLAAPAAPALAAETVARPLIGSAAVVSATGTLATGVAASDRLAPDARLSAGQQIAASDGSYRFEMQTDGNAVIYNAANQSLWSSQSSSAGSTLVMQGDGNLVVYAAGWQPTWNAQTSRAGSTLIMQGDGNLVVYTQDGTPVWNSFANGAVMPAQGTPVTGSVGEQLTANQQLSAGQQLTSSGGVYSAVMQGDGNFVVYGPSGAIWNSRTSAAGSHMVMQSDGNAVVYSTGNAPTWFSGSSADAGVKMVMQSDGNLVIYRADGTPVWNSVADAKPALSAAVQAQLAYVLAHWSSRNTAAYGSLGSTDCVNFASQSLIARGWAMNGSWWHKVSGGKHTYSSAWISSTSMRNYFAAHPELANALSDSQRNQVAVGDIVQFDWDNSGDRDHTGIVTRIEGNTIYFAGHSDDSDYRSVDQAITVDHPGGTAYYWHLAS